MYSSIILFGFVIPIVVIVGSIVFGMCDNKRVVYKLAIISVCTFVLTLVVLWNL